jgi:hypothetical protein
MDVSRVDLGVPAGGVRADSGPAGAREAATRAGRRFVDVLAGLDARGGAAASPAVRAPALRVGATPGGALVRGTLQTLFAEEQKMDAIIRAARAGKTFSAGELLALQSSVFRYTQTVEVVARATDRVLAALKQALSTQV